MAIVGAHVLLYSTDADGLRAVLRAVFGWHHVDAGDGWLIYALPPAEVAVHPADTASHELTLMCDDIESTVTDLRSKGIEFEGDPHDAGWGVVTTMVLPGGVRLLLYQPRHPTALQP